MKSSIFLLLTTIFFTSCESKKSTMQTKDLNVISYYNYGGLGIPLFEKWKATKSQDGDIEVDACEMSMTIGSLFIIDNSSLHDTVILSYLHNFRTGHGIHKQAIHFISLSSELDLTFANVIQFEGDSALAIQILDKFHKEIKILDKAELRRTIDSLYVDGYDW